MKITSISAANFKIGTFTTKLTPITCIVADNGKGKTSRLDAIQLALCGYHPRLPKTAAGIMSLSCGSPMSVTALLEDGSNLQRIWTRRGDKVAKEESAACASLNVPSVLIDPDAYFSLSDKERVKYVFGLVPMPDAADTFTELVAALKNHKFEENTVQSEEAIKGIVAFVNQHNDPAAIHNSVQDRLECLIHNLKVKKSEADASIKRMTGTVQGVTELATEALSDPTPEINAAKATLERLLGEQRDLQNALNRAQEVQQQREVIQKQILELSVSDANSFALQREVDFLRQGIEAYVSQTEKLDTEYASIMASKNKAQQDGAKMGQDALKAQQQAQERTRLEQELAQAQQEALGLAELEAELAKKEQRKKVLAKSSRLVEADVVVLNTAAELLSSLDMFTSNELVRMIRDNATQIIDTGTLQAQVCEKKKSAFNAQRATDFMATLPPKPDLEALGAALEAKRTEYKELAAQLPVLEQKLRDSRAADLTVQTQRITLVQKEAELTRLNEAPKRIKELEEQLGTMVVPVLSSRTAEIDDAIILARREIFVLDTRYKQFIAQKGEAATKQKALNQRLLLEAESAVAKVAVELVQEKQSEMVELAFVDILTIANEVTRGVLPALLEYQDGEIGMNRPIDAANHKLNAPTQWVSHKTMSGSEQLVCYASLAVSLAAKSPVRILLLDEAHRLDTEHSASLMRNLCQMIETGALDNVVLAGLVAPVLPPEVQGSEMVSVVAL